MGFPILPNITKNEAKGIVVWKGDFNVTNITNKQPSSIGCNGCTILGLCGHAIKID
jgi:hypothetical protein